MFQKISTFLLLLCFQSSLQGQLPDCKDVNLYFCPFVKGSSAQNAIYSSGSKLMLGITIPNGKEGISAMQISGPHPEVERIFCSDHTEAFDWVKEYPDWHKAPSDKGVVNVQIIDGVPRSLQFEMLENDKVTVKKFLQMKCHVTAFEGAPKVIYTNSLVKWHDYHSNIPKNAIEGGIDPHTKRPFYIGLLKLHDKTYVAKIIQRTVYIHVVLDVSRQVYVTSFRNVLILTNDDEKGNVKVSWKRVNNPHLEDSTSGHIYRCMGKYEHYLTSILEACKGTVTDKLVYEDNFRV